MADFKKGLMTKTEKGSPDGIRVRTYDKDGEYDLPTELADVFIYEMECAEEVESEDPAEDDKKEPKADKKQGKKGNKK